MIQSKTSIGIDTRLNLRAVDLRRNFLKSIFRIRNTALKAAREILSEHVIIEVNTPKMIATAQKEEPYYFQYFITIGKHF